MAKRAKRKGEKRFRPDLRLDSHKMRITKKSSDLRERKRDESEIRED